VSNLRWATKSEQNNNRSHRTAPLSTSIPVTLHKDDQTHRFTSFWQAEKELGIKAGSLSTAARVNAEEGRTNFRRISGWLVQYDSREDEPPILPGEVWKKCIESDALYLSSEGRIKQRHRGTWMPPRSVKRSMKTDYPTVRVEGKLKALHRLVWEAFNGQLPPGMIVDHIVEGNKCDARLDNLQCITQRENVLKRKRAAKQ
jgi:hypothetical protein